MLSTASLLTITLLATMNSASAAAVPAAAAAAAPPAGTVVSIKRKHSNLTKAQRAVRGAAHTIHKVHPNKANLTVANILSTIISNAGASSNTGNGTSAGGVALSLINQGNELFTAPITLGNGQKFTLDLDSGSSDTWFRGAQCQAVQNDGSCTGTAVNPQDATLKTTGISFQTNYGSGAVLGTVFNAPVTLGNFQATFPVGISQKEVGFSQTDGLMGLAFNSISQIAAATGGQSANIMDNLFGNTNHNIASFFLSNAADQHNQGEVTFGGVDPTKFTGPLTAVALNSESFWQFDFTGTTFSVNGVTGDAAGGLNNAIADTGTSLLILAQAPATAINNAIGATFDATQGIFTFADCTKALAQPPITFTLQGKPYAIPANIYVIQAGAGNCFSGISTSGAASGQAILGDTWIRAQYTVFDKSSKQVLFATAVHN